MLMRWYCSKRVNWIKYAKINSFFFLLTTVTLTILTLLTVKQASTDVLGNIISISICLILGVINLFLMFKLKKMMLDNLFIKSFYKVMIIISFLPIFILVWISPQAMEGFILIRKDEEESNGSDYA
jgi:hypothetical protein